MKYKVFFSHSVRDKDWVNWITRNLTGPDMQIWLSEYDIQPGEYITTKVEQNISDCDCFVVLLTKNSQQSVFVQNEIGCAQALKKPIVPLAESGIDKSRLGMLTGREYITFRKHQPYEALREVSNFLYRDKSIKERGQNIVIGGFLGLLFAALVLGDEED
ncbi:MAG: toll/interleukin-1 receptor domain-containing protein [candidate division Zixibacteria bacterium]|nr:toll/interleukin-1 receptor domain-containing protein [candidate division Zixibacteria bacterium]